MQRKPLQWDATALAAAQADGARQVLDAIWSAPQGLEWHRAMSAVVRLEMEALKQQGRAMAAELAQAERSTKRIVPIKTFTPKEGPPWATQS